MDELNLDYYEGVPTLYSKEKITVPKANIKSYSENKKYSVITAK